MAEYPSLLPRGEHEEFESSRDLPQKNRRAFNKDAQNTDENFTQVETKHGSTWTESEQEVRKPRVKQDIPIVVDAGPSVQVETKVPPTEADIGAELIKTMFTVAKRGTDATIVEVKPPQTLEISVDGAEPAVLRSNRKNIGGAEVVSESQFTPMQMAEIDRIKTHLHELDSKASIRELTTDEFADRANLELELEDIYGPFQEQQEQASFEDKKKYLNGRDKELGAKAKEFGIKVESHIRNAGEWYRKLPLKYKIGVAGALLGLNVATGGASTFVTLFTGTAMIGQRALGSASVYALIDGLYEKRLQKEEKKRGSDRTKFERWKKRGYSTAAALAVFIGLPGYAIKEGFDAVGGGGLLKALGSLMGHTIPAEVTPVTVPSGVSTDQVADEAKKVLEETKEQLAKEIIERDKIQAGLEQVKQQIAEEKAQVAAEASTPQETRQALRTAVEKITKLTETASAKFEMPKHADFSIHEDDTTISPYDVTPTDQTPAEDIGSVEVEEVEEQVETSSASAPEATPAEPLPVEKVSEPVVYQKVEADVLQTAGNVEATPVEVPAPPAEAPVSSVETPSPVGETPTLQAEQVKEWTNPNGVKVDPLRGSVYQYPNGVPVAYGNGALEAAQNFAKANPNTSVWVQADKPVLYEGKLHQWVYEVKYGGFWRGMQILGADGPSDPSHIITIDPKALVKRLGE